MSTTSKKGHLYGVAVLSIVVLTLSSYCYLTKRSFPSNNMYLSDETFVHTIPLKHKKYATMKACEMSSAAQKKVWSLLDANATASLPLPHVGSYQCRDQICSEFLSVKDREQLCVCKDSPKSGIVPKCHFMNGTHRAPIALVSFPGSGNTWVRGLLEKATGICTGSLFCDTTIRNSGAIGEHVSSGSVLVVKTHAKQLRFSNYTEAQHSGGYGAAILIVRNPLQAIVAEWNRRSSKSRVKQSGHNPHVASVSENYFGNYTKWQTFVSAAISWWKKQTINVLLKNKSHPVLLVCYEDILKNSTTEVKRMLDFLQVQYTDSNLKKRLAEDYSAFHRNHTSTFEHYSENQKQLVISGIKEVLYLLKQRRWSILGMKKYLEVQD